MKVLNLAILAICAFMFISCAHNAGNDPIQPPSVRTAHLEPSNRHLLGFWKIAISSDHQSIDIVPLRTADIHLNTVRMLETEPCTNCLTVENIESFGDDRVRITIKLKHPYTSDHTKLTAFDVRGIVMLPGSYEFPGTGITVAREELGDPVLVGPDGYSRLFNPKEFPEGSPGPPALHYIKGYYASADPDAPTLNPYLVFVPEVERNHFPAGKSASRVYDLKLPPGPIKLGYAVDVNWYNVDGPVENVPDDFPLSANSVEAYRIVASIGKGLTPSGTGTARVVIEVFDWQGADTIDQVLITAPDLFIGNIEATFSTVSDEGVVYETQIQNSLQAPIGDYPFLVTIIDTEEDPNLGPVAAYQMITAHVTLTGVWIRELVYIPAGEFLMGGDPDFDPQVNETMGETPQHLHPTGEYYISRFEITNEEYAPFIADGGYFNPAYWSPEGWDWRVAEDITSPRSWNLWPITASHNGTGFPDYPVYHLAWFEAEAFCNWAGGRLPTEPEWEKAARGTDGRIWPWGNEWDKDKCQCGWLMFNAGLAPVGSHSPEGDSPYGVSDAIGNVREWASDWMNYHIYDQYADGDFTPPTEPTYENKRVIRGGTQGDNYASTRLRTSSRWASSDYSQNSAGAVRIVFDP